MPGRHDGRRHVHDVSEPRGRARFLQGVLEDPSLAVDVVSGAVLVAYWHVARQELRLLRPHACEGVSVLWHEWLQEWAML